MAADREAAARAIEAFLRAIGRDPSADAELAGTGPRVADAFIDELCDGYAVDVPALLEKNLIDAGAEVSRELVIVRDIAVSTMCPHHLLPAHGLAHVAFAPRDRMLGIGAVVSLVDAFAHRLTLQEVIGREVARALTTALQPSWAACRIVLSHACMTARGERRHGALVETFALEGSGDAGVAYAALGADPSAGVRS
ncbi:MAG: GTP cyclohydrolase I [Polyangiaceae bacterium]